MAIEEHATSASTQVDSGFRIVEVERKTAIGGYIARLERAYMSWGGYTLGTQQTTFNELLERRNRPCKKN